MANDRNREGRSGSGSSGPRSGIGGDFDKPRSGKDSNTSTGRDMNPDPSQVNDLASDPGYGDGTLDESWHQRRSSGSSSGSNTSGTGGSGSGTR